MGLAKTERELRDETRARRAKQDLKNTPLPLKYNSSLHETGQKRIFNDAHTSESNKRALKSLLSQRMKNDLSKSRSMSDLHRCASADRSTILGRYSKSSQDLLDRYSKSSQDVLDTNSLRRSKSYSRIMDQQSALDKRLHSYNTTRTNMFTNTQHFSPRSVATLSSDSLLKDIQRSCSVKHLPSPSVYSSNYEVENYQDKYQDKYRWKDKIGLGTSGQYLSRSTSHLPISTKYQSGRGDISSFSKSSININSYSNTSTDCMKKAIRQLKVATTWLSNTISSIECRQNIPSKWSTQASSNRFNNLRARFA